MSVQYAPIVLGDSSLNAFVRNVVAFCGDLTRTIALLGHELVHIEVSNVDVPPLVSDFLVCLYLSDCLLWDEWQLHVRCHLPNLLK